MKTIIHSNGSKWSGEAPDSIERLIEILKEYTIEERFFHKFGVNKNNELDHNDIPYKWKNLCPIDTDYKNSVFPHFKDTIEDGTCLFFGNFLEISHVFRIETNDPEIIEKLSTAIKANKGWIMYYDKNLAKSIV